MNLIQLLNSLFPRKHIVAKIDRAGRIPNLPIHPNYTGNGKVNQ